LKFSDQKDDARRSLYFLNVPNQYNLSVTSDIQFGGNGNVIHFLHKGDVMPVSRILASPNLTIG
jgi:hypothetical protein